MSHFFAYLARMKFIHRWNLMRNTRPENIQEHSLQVAMIAHALAVIRNRHFGGYDSSSHDSGGHDSGGHDSNGYVNPERVALLALYHDVGEVITGDLATPIKYFNPSIKSAYREIEGVARTRLFEMLPDSLKPDFESILFATDSEHKRLVKAADKLCAYLKCLEEQRAGNQEFSRAEKAIKDELERMALPEVRYFLKTFGESFLLTLDELN